MRRAKVTFAWWARFKSEGRKVTTRSRARRRKPLGAGKTEAQAEEILTP
ncbi:MAG: hypothetical protein OXG81_13460 [Acidobacteria bacterium]|nr:hypothetical protein [Acidobacteriota bacterium]